MMSVEPQPICTEVSTLGDLLVQAAAGHPSRAALVFPDSRLSYAELQDGALEVARGLAALGVRTGQHVGLFIANSPEYAQALFGVTLLGAVAVPLNVRHRASELTYIIANADLAAVLTSGRDTRYLDLPALLVEALAPDGDLQADPAQALRLPAAPSLRYIVDLGDSPKPGLIGHTAFRALGGQIAPQTIEQMRRGVRVRDPALILYTSGTTAHPKGCLLSHEAATRGPVERARYRLSADGHDVTWAAGPLYHIGSLAPFIGSVGAAGTFLSDRYFDAGRAIALMRRNGVTLAWPWFSAIVQELINHPDFDPKTLPDLKHLFMIAPDALVDRVQDLLPQTEILQACGMTETAGVFALSDPSEDRRSRSTTQGKPAPGVEVRIVDPATGEPCPPGRMGEIWVRGFCVMDGYYAAPEQTRVTLIDFCAGRIARYKIPRAVHFVTPSEWPMSATKVDKRALRERLKQQA